MTYYRLIVWRPDLPTLRRHLGGFGVDPADAERRAREGMAMAFQGHTADAHLWRAVSLGPMYPKLREGQL